MAHTAKQTNTVQPSILPTLPPDVPVLFRDEKGSLLRPRDDMTAFLARDLDVSKLDKMVEHGLWLAGRRGNIRPLHRQKVLGRRIIVTEHLDLHLLWHNDILFVKPLTSYLLDEKFMQPHLAADPKLQQALNGLLLSYTNLINHPSDFRIAQDEHLLPSSMDWSGWQTLFDSKLHSLLEQFRAGNHPPCSSPRFYFGELRLNRVDYIYRLHPAYRLKHVMRGYHRMPTTYQGFLTRNFAWLIVVFAYLSVILGAMQVGLGTDELRDNGSFNRASYGFAIFSMVLPGVALIAGTVVSLILTFYHVGATYRHSKSTG